MATRFWSARPTGTRSSSPTASGADAGAQGGWRCGADIWRWKSRCWISWPAIICRSWLAEFHLERPDWSALFCWTTPAGIHWRRWRIWWSWAIRRSAFWQARTRCTPPTRDATHFEQTMRGVGSASPCGLDCRVRPYASARAAVAGFERVMACLSRSRRR